jgi:DNA-binding response OmpR family regulator
LLVEEYDALAIAIASALKKYAPLHGVYVARSIVEAETIAAEMNPELFLLDLDPPPVGDVEFLVRLQARYPDSRALVIASGASRELRAERGPAGAVQFIEKPFDLAEFGAAVQALLGRWATPPSETFRGTLRDLHVIDIVQLKCLGLSTALVRLETPDGRSGEIYFRRGEITHATTGNQAGVAAFDEMVSWPGGRMRETELPAEAPQTIDQPWAVLLLRAVRKATEQKPATPRQVNVALAPAPSGRNKTILVIDDTEMLLIFAADVLGTADRSFRILTAASGRAGLEMAAEARPDLILLDYSLAETTGAEICRELLLNVATARIPVLMMSGHLPELAKTAATYRNVVATLPKPFLSGALINAVEKILASGPLPETPHVPPPASDIPPASSGLAPPTAPGTESLPPTLTAPSAPPPSPAVETPPSAPNQPPPQASWHTGSGNGHAANGPIAFTIVEPPAAEESFRGPRQFVAQRLADEPVSKEVSVTFSLQILTMKLTPDFRVSSLRLTPAEVAVGLSVPDGHEIEKLLNTGFRMGSIQLTPAGELESLLLIPTQEPPWLPAVTKDFQVSGVRIQPDDDMRVVELSAATGGSMRVYLTVPFNFLTVRLSPSFQVAAIVLGWREEAAQIWSGPGNTTVPFSIEQAQLDDANQLRELFVRAIR